MKKTACVYHSRDLDGWMSAAIVKRALMKEEIPGRTSNENQSFDFIGWDYGDYIPDLTDYSRVIMVDISFPKYAMLTLRSNLGKNFIWIDHHISAIKDLVPEDHKEPAFEGLLDTRYAACELTWMHFFPDENMPEIVRLLGRYDCFGHKGTSEEQKVLEFQYGARALWSNYEQLYQELILFDKGKANRSLLVLDMGRSIYQYLCTEAKQTYKKAFPLSLNEPIFNDHNGELMGEKGRKFLCVNQERFNPINFGIDYHKDGYDGFACFWLNEKGSWSFSLYNDNGEVDCSVIAKQFNGGGHKGAAGFVVVDINKFFKYNS